MATEFLDPAERCFRNARTLEPGEMRWPYYLGHIERQKNEPAKAAALFEEALKLQPDHVPSLVWLGEMRLVEGRPEAAAAAAREGAVAAATGGCRALSARPREPGRAGLRRRREEPRSRARAPASGVEHPLSAGARLSWARRRAKRRGADAAARERGRASGRSADAAGRRAAAERRGIRSPRRRGARETPMARGGHPSSQGRRAGARQRVHAPQPRHRLVPDRRRQGRARAVPDRRQAVARTWPRRTTASASSRRRPDAIAKPSRRSPPPSRTTRLPSKRT